MKMLHKSLEKNIAFLQSAFEGCGDIVAREIPVGRDKRYGTYITYIDGLVDRDYIEKQLITNLVVFLRNDPPDLHFGLIKDSILNSGAATADISEITTTEEAALAMASGDCVFLIDGVDTGIVLSSKGWPSRGIGQPESEMSLQGSKDAFSESMRMNTALIRRRIRDINLKIKQLKVGQRSQTDVAVVYLQDVVRPDILKEALLRIEKINIDAILDSGYVEQLIEDTGVLPFPKTQVTERPDKAAAAVLEGRIAIIVDNSPFVILIPATINTFFQVAEDYYQRYEIMSFLRVMRYCSAFISITLSGLYLSFTLYQPSMIPTALVLKMAAARQSVPFPAVFEIIIMELAFELLREAGVRLPGLVGGTLGIVGGLIMGQAAVEAGIVSPIVVIVAALSGIASFAIPHQSLVSGLRLTKFYIIGFSAFLGLFGLWIALLSLLAGLIATESFGVPYTYPFGCSDLNNKSDMKDAIIRAPINKMVTRPFFANPDERQRMK